MSYTEKEISRFNAQPIELYRFVKGEEVWTQTSSDEDFLYLSEDYVQTSIQRTSFEQSGEDNANRITLTVPREHPIAQHFVSFVPADAIWLTIMRVHRNDGEVLKFWQGVVRSAEFKNSTAELLCDSLDSLVNRMGLRRLHGRLCNNMLYDNLPAGCPVPAIAYTVEAVVTATSGYNLTSAAFATKPDGWFNAGFLKRGNNDWRLITSHVGSQITLLAPFRGSLNGETVEALAGCDHTFTTCVSKFGLYTDNGGAFGGFDIPEKNPFTSSIV